MQAFVWKVLTALAWTSAVGLPAVAIGLGAVFLRRVARDRRSEKTLQRERRRLAALGELARESAGGTEPSCLYGRAARLLSECLDVEFTAALERQADERTLLLTAGVGWPDRQIGRAAWSVGPDPPTRATANVEPGRGGGRCNGRAFLEAHGIVSGISAAVRGRSGHLAGVLAAFSTRRSRFDQEEAEFLRAAADILSTAARQRETDAPSPTSGERFGVHGADGDAHGQLRRALHEAEQRKNEFLATLAHELRNPLTPICNAVEVLRLRGADDSEIRWSADLIVHETEQLVRLVDDLMDVSRIAHGKVSLQRERIRLRTVVDRAVETFRHQIESRGQELSIALPPEDLWLEADEMRLVQVLENLLDNAAKYTEQGGHIWITAGRERDEVVVRVRDDGMGIPPEMLPRVFDLFAQAEFSESRSEGGLGIGLQLVARLIEAHGGRIEVFSEGRGDGSEFVVRLPALAEADEPPREEDAPTEHDGPAASGRRVLVVDDQRNIVESVARLLGKKGHSVQTARSGPEALETAGSFRPEVVLIDIGLPEMDGCEVARRLRRTPGGEEIVLVALTGYSHEEMRSQVREAGFHHHLVKPLSIGDLDDLLAAEAAGA